APRTRHRSPSICPRHPPAPTPIPPTWPWTSSPAATRRARPPRCTAGAPCSSTTIPKPCGSWRGVWRATTRSSWVGRRDRSSCRHRADDTDLVVSLEPGATLHVANALENAHGRGGIRFGGSVSRPAVHLSLRGEQHLNERGTHVCATCGAHYPGDAPAPTVCRICADERQ